MKQTIAIFFLFFVVGCSKPGAKFILINESDTPIDSISITTSGENHFMSYVYLNPNKTLDYWLEMSNTPKTDGDYIITFKYRNSLPKKIQTGYYTNGYALEKHQILTFNYDTLSLKQISGSD